VSKGRVLGGLEATLAIAGVTIKRALRAKAMIGAACVAVLPYMFAASLHQSHHDDRVTVFSIAALAGIVIAALVVAGPIGEEFEERTMTYLWSRPLPRWSVIAGKLAALAPIAMILIAASVGASFATMTGDAARSSVGDGVAAAAGGMLAMSCLAAAIATLVPKQALALTIAYLFFIDLPLGVIPARLQLVSITYHQAELTRLDLDESQVAAAIGLGVIAIAWLAVALWRVRRIE
jgi:ABC-type transport system involved in multi-copper enzyme maturation permease subunit